MKAILEQIIHLSTLAEKCIYLCSKNTCMLTFKSCERQCISLSFCNCAEYVHVFDYIDPIHTHKLIN